jgi:Phosphotransferase enzyme family
MPLPPARRGRCDSRRAGFHAAAHFSLAHPRHTLREPSFRVRRVAPPPTRRRRESCAGSIPAASMKSSTWSGRTSPGATSARLTGVGIPSGDALFSSGWLSRALEASSVWQRGSVTVVTATRIGADYGLSGRIHRVVAKTERVGSVSFIVKEEGSAEVERELLFRSNCGESLRGCIPDSFGGVIDRQPAAGFFCARRHRSRGAGRRPPRMHPLPGRICGACAGTRTRSILEPPSRPPSCESAFDRGVFRATRDLPAQVARALDQLKQGPASWIQVDAHLDNVLWRLDGTAVLLDWCNAAIGPPVTDIARFFVEGVVGVSEPDRLSALLSTYVEELEKHGTRIRLSELRAGFALALWPENRARTSRRVLPELARILYPFCTHLSWSHMT